jgi:hypothetical protein
MAAPSIEVLGVHRLTVTEDLLREQMEILYPPRAGDIDRAGAEQHVRDQLDSTVLIEALVRNRDGHFDIGDFTQPDESLPRSNWQVAWAEAYLSADGEALAVERWSPAPASGDLRVAFFLHYWDPGRPLRSSYGDLQCPLPKGMPKRLAKLVPYEPVD